MKFVFLGLSITSSWGNGHATNYRALLRELHRADHTVVFLERDVPWYAAHRDLASPPWGRTILYGSLAELETHQHELADADLVVVGSYVPSGVDVGSWALSAAACPVAFWDIDTPVTVAKLAAGDHEYLSPELVRRYDLYLSFTGGPILDELEDVWGAQRAEAFYCMVDTDSYYPGQASKPFLAGYLGTYSADRQEHFEQLLLEPARRLPHRRFVVAGPQYPPELEWPRNITRIEHLSPDAHRPFYLSQLFTVNVTREAMRDWGWSPSVRLFEAAACCTPIITDDWPGLDAFFEPGREILVAADADEAFVLLTCTSECERRAMVERARTRVVREHSATRRAQELVAYAQELVGAPA
jgi:spore maturation protein CgeB